MIDHSKVTRTLVAIDKIKFFKELSHLKRYGVQFSFHAISFMFANGQPQQPKQNICLGSKKLQPNRCRHCQTLAWP